MAKNVPASPRQDLEVGLTRGTEGGRRVTKYDPNVAMDICQRVANGETLRAICKREEGMPVSTTFHRWVVNSPELARAYAAARELSAHALEEEAIDLAREIRLLPDTSQKVRAYEVAMNQFRWSAARRNPKVFSERGTTTFIVPIQINTTLDMGEGTAGQSTPEFPDLYTIDVAAKVVDEPAEPVPSVENKDLMQRDAKPLVPEGPVQRRRLGRKPWKKKLTPRVPADAV